MVVNKIHCSPENNSRQAESDPLKRFKPLFRLSFLCGIPFIFPDRVFHCRYVTMVISTILLNLLFVVSCVGFFVDTPSKKSWKAASTYYIYHISSMALHFNGLRNCRKILGIVEGISRFHQEMKLPALGKVYGIYCQLLAPVAIASLWFYRIVSMIRNADPSKNVFFHIRLVLVEMNYFMTTLTATSVSLIAYNTHLYAKELLIGFADVVVRSSRGVRGMMTVRMNTMLLSRILTQTRGIEDGFKNLTFFAISCVVCMLFDLISEITEKSNILPTGVVRIFVLQNMLALVPVILLIFAASDTQQEAENLKNLTSVYVDNQQHAANDIILFNLKLLSSQVKFTAAEAFTLTKGSLLTALGVIITYGLLIFPNI